ncbi:MAG: accessory factor UbiK family protein [Alphaproteobacteria bacterium]|nr:accessory factor UbiK family protein [Alphaproteobacteria bacterium]
MQTDNRLFDDLAKVANGALHTMSGVRDEFENRIRERVERWLGEMDMVPREEFDAIKAVAQAARAEQEALTARVEALEKRISTLEGARTATKRTSAARSKTTAKTGARPKNAPARKTAPRQKAAD